MAQEQSSYVATNAKSIAEAYFEPKAWFRAIGAGDELVGFAMVYRDPAAGIFYVWRFMIDARHQGRGYARRAMALLLDEARACQAPRRGRNARGRRVLPRDCRAGSSVAREVLER